MTLAAHPLVLAVSATDGSYTEVDGVNDLSFGPNRAMLMTTDFKDTSGAQTRMAGLKDGTIQISGDAEFADAPQNLIRTQEDNGGDLFVRIYWDGIAGHKVKCIVESYQVNGGVDGKVEFSATLQFNGAPVAV